MRTRLRDTWAELRPYFNSDDVGQWFVLLGTSLAAGLGQSLTLAVFNDAVATYARGERTATHLAGVVILAAIAIGAGYFGALRGHVVSTRMAVRLRNRLLDEVGAANLRVIERVRHSAMHFHLMGTIGSIAGAYSAFLSFTMSLVMLTCNFVYVAWLSPVGFAAALCITGLGITIHFRQERLNIERKQRLDKLSNALSSRHRELLDGYKELRLSFSKWADYRKRLDHLNDTILKEGLQVTNTSVSGELATYFFQFLFVAMIVFMLPQLSRIEPVVLMQLMTAVLVTMGPLSGVVGAVSTWTRTQVALANLRMLHEEIAATRETAAGAGVRALPRFEQLEMRGVEFAFEDEDTAQPFRLGPIDLAVRRGEVVFIVGGNGSGKTVLLRVLTGLYHHTAGEIYFNGERVDTNARQAYRESFATVFSDFHLFRDLLGHSAIDEAAVNAWLARVGLADKTTFEQGSFSSVSLSAGQRKRLAFVTAILDDRPIMVLDEFGAEQDPEHRRRFYRELIEHLREAGKTAIVVTHDDAYFECGDRVVKMDFGKIVSETRPAGTTQVPEIDLLRGRHVGARV